MQLAELGAPIVSEPSLGMRRVLPSSQVSVVFAASGEPVAADLTGVRDVRDLRRRIAASCNVRTGRVQLLQDSTVLVDGSDVPYSVSVVIKQEDMMGFHEGSEALPEGLRRLLREDMELSRWGDVVAFSTFDDAYIQAYEEYRKGDFRSQLHMCRCCKSNLIFTPPVSICCKWMACLPCAHDVPKAMWDADHEVEEAAERNACVYHIIFPRDYVVMLYRAKTDVAEEYHFMTTHAPIYAHLLEAAAVDDLDDHMRVSGCGLGQCSLSTPPLPGVRFKGRAAFFDANYLTMLDKEHFNKMICEGEDFANALRRQMAICELQGPRYQTAFGTWHAEAPPMQQAMPGGFGDDEDRGEA